MLEKAREIQVQTERCTFINEWCQQHKQPLIDYFTAQPAARIIDLLPGSPDLIATAPAAVWEQLAQDLLAQKIPGGPYSIMENTLDFVTS